MKDANLACIIVVQPCSLLSQMRSLMFELD